MEQNNTTMQHECTEQNIIDQKQFCQINTTTIPLWDPPLPSFNKTQFAHISLRGRTEVCNDVMGFIGYLQSSNSSSSSSSSSNNAKKKIKKDSSIIECKEVWGYDKDDDGEYVIQYKPAKGQWTIYYDNEEIIVVVSYRTDNIVSSQHDGPAMYYEVHLFSINGYEFLEKFIHAARRHYHMKSNRKKIVCRRFTNGSYWSIYAKHIKRKLETLFLPESIKDDIINDIENFLRSEQDYIEFGIPYKRVYLLSGKPGTGKTSLAFALACHFNLDLYIFPFDKYASDHALNNAVASLDNDGILLLEDVDQGIIQDKVSLSGITNVLDGVNYKNRMIIFMTTNFLELLSDITTRDQRVNKHVVFTYADQYQIQSMLQYFFPLQCGETVIDFENKVKPKLKNVCQHLVQKSVTTATLSQFLFDHRMDKDILDVIIKQRYKIALTVSNSKADPKSLMYQ